MAKVLAPNKDYAGVSAGVKFKDGVGETSDENLITWFLENGYEVEKTSNKPANVPATPAKTGSQKKTAQTKSTAKKTADEKPSENQSSETDQSASENQDSQNADGNADAENKE